MRIGIYSGTFDPVHNGHLALAQEALERCELDRVVFLPEALPRGKANVTPLTHRLRMLELAVAGQAAFSVIGLHSERFSTADTLPELHGLFPNASFTLIIGSDVVRTFSDRWPDLDVLLDEVPLAIGLRAADTAIEIDRLMSAFPKARYVIVAANHHSVSSSAARNQGNVEGIPELVARYITEQQLYI